MKAARCTSVKTGHLKNVQCSERLHSCEESVRCGQLYLAGLKEKAETRSLHQCRLDKEVIAGVKLNMMTQRVRLPTKSPKSESR